MEIQIESKEDIRTFFIEENGERLAEMSARMRGEDRIAIEHTEVSGKLKGKGIGKQLVDKGVEYARKNHLKIIPLCHFARAVFEKSDEYKDVL